MGSYVGLHVSPQTHSFIHSFTPFLHSFIYQQQVDTGLGSEGQCREELDPPQEFPKPYAQGFCVEMALVEVAQWDRTEEKSEEGTPLFTSCLHFI